MSWKDLMSNELHLARAELAAAEAGLATGTEAARARYARALHEADRAERQALRVQREPQQLDSWRPAAI